jgi:hypothetical protein
MKVPDGAIRSDFDAHDYVVGLPIRQVVRELVDLLGSTTVAVIGGVKETRAVQQWMVDREPQRPHVLRFSLQIGLMLTSRADKEFAQAWFHAANPRLSDRIPMLLLRDMALDDIQHPLLGAARAFATRGEQVAG